MFRVKLNRKAVELAIIRRNLTQNGLARRLDISSGYMSQIMTGDRCPSAAIRQRLLLYLPEHTFDDLFIIETSEDDQESKKD